MSRFLDFTNLTKRYGPITALAEVNLAVERGSVLALLGPNGAGKSTLFGCLLGLTQPSAGHVTRRGETITATDRARFGYVSERVALYPHRTVRDNARFFAQLKGHARKEVDHQLERVGLDSKRDRKAGQLSKGMLQRLGLAIALCGAPELLVLDEPFNGLDPVLLETLQTILRSETERGATLLISTHTISAVEPLATHGAILLEGRLAAQGELAALRQAHGGGSLEAAYHQVARQQRAASELELAV